MARLLSYHSPSSGNMYPAIDMLLELRRRGHEVHLRTRASDVDGYGALGLRAAAWVAQGDLAARRGDDRASARLERLAAEALQDFRF